MKKRGIVMKPRLIFNKDRRVTDIAYKLTTLEVSCHCNDPACHFTLIGPTLLVAWDKFRMAYGKSVQINSAYRCQAHNKKVGSVVNNSRHTIGNALDLSLRNQNRINMIKLAKCEFKFVKVYANFIHVDMRND